MINNVVLVGRLTKDVEVKRTTNNISVANFTLAINDIYKDSSGQKTTNFINCVAWRQSADFLGNYSHKGSLIAVQGKLSQRSYERRDGGKQIVIEVVCDSVQLLDSKSSSYSNNSQNYNNYQNNNESSMNNNSNNDFSDLDSVMSSDNTEDDLPF